MPPAISSPVVRRLHGERHGEPLDPTELRVRIGMIPRGAWRDGVSRGARRDRTAALRRSAPRIRSCSRWPMPAPPNGIGRTRPGSSSNSCCCRIFRVTRSSTPLRLSVQFLLRGRRSPPCAPAARPLDPAGLRRRSPPIAGHVDQAVERLLASADAATLAEVLRILEIGLHHEQQHQELILTDILHALAQNPTAPAYDARLAGAAARSPRPVSPSCRAASGASAGPATGYCFDNECPAHDVLLPPARIARGLVTNAQWLEFMADGGYATPTPVALRRLGGGRGRGLAARPAIGASTTAPGSR